MYVVFLGNELKHVLSFFSMFLIIFILEILNNYVECPFIGGNTCKLSLKDGKTLGNEQRISIPLNTRCELRFENCPIGECITIFDHTFKKMYGNPKGPKLSLFSNFSVANGQLFWKGSQVSFRVYSSQFDVNFTTKTPEEYYLIHPEDRENSTKIFEISQFHRGRSSCDDL